MPNAKELNELREQIKTLEHDHRAEFESREKARQEAYRNTAIHMKTCSREKKARRASHAVAHKTIHTDTPRNS